MRRSSRPVFRCSGFEVLKPLTRPGTCRRHSRPPSQRSNTMKPEDRLADAIAHSGMRRRLILASAGALTWPPLVRADLLSSLSSSDATAGIRAALRRGAGAAVDLLGKTDGFWGNE